ncbi:MAG: hypothetical protein KF861_22965 [Planctomycetaceae bacterium]|nr:hypothetical protein [Planctomycetaceae bacterium]
MLVTCSDRAEGFYKIVALPCAPRVGEMLLLRGKQFDDSRKVEHVYYDEDPQGGFTFEAVLENYSCQGESLEFVVRQFIESGWTMD